MTTKYHSYEFNGNTYKVEESEHVGGSVKIAVAGVYILIRGVAGCCGAAQLHQCRRSDRFSSEGLVDVDVHKSLDVLSSVLTDKSLWRFKNAGAGWLLKKGKIFFIDKDPDVREMSGYKGYMFSMAKQNPDQWDLHTSSVGLGSTNNHLVIGEHNSGELSS